MDGFQQLHVSGAPPTTSYQDFSAHYPPPAPNQPPTPPGVPVQDFQTYLQAHSQPGGEEKVAVRPQPPSFPPQPPPPPPGEPPPGVGDTVEYGQGIHQQAYSETPGGTVYWNGQEQAHWSSEYYKPETQGQYYQDIGQTYQDYYQFQQYETQYAAHDVSQMGQYDPSQVQPPQQYYSHQVPGVGQGDEIAIPSVNSAHIDSAADSHSTVTQIPVDLSQVIIPQAMAQQYIVPHQLQPGTGGLGMIPSMVASKPKSAVPEWLKEEMMKRGIKQQPDEAHANLQGGENKDMKQGRRFTEGKPGEMQPLKQVPKHAGAVQDPLITEAKKTNKDDTVALNKVVKAIALPLLLSVTDSLFVEIAKEVLEHPGDGLASGLAMEIITDVADELCAELAREAHKEASSARMAHQTARETSDGREEGESAMQEVAGTNLLGLGYASDSSNSNGGIPKGSASPEGIVPVASDQEGPQLGDNSEAPLIPPNIPDGRSNLKLSSDKAPEMLKEDRDSCIDAAVTRDIDSGDVLKKNRGRIPSRRGVGGGGSRDEQPPASNTRHRLKAGGAVERVQCSEEDRAHNRGGDDQGHGESSQRQSNVGGSAYRSPKSQDGMKTRERSKRSRESSPSKSRTRSRSKIDDAKRSSEGQCRQRHSGSKKQDAVRKKHPKHSEGRKRSNLSSGDEEGEEEVTDTPGKKFVDGVGVIGKQNPWNETRVEDDDGGEEDEDER